MRQANKVFEEKIKRIHLPTGQKYQSEILSFIEFTERSKKSPQYLEADKLDIATYILASMMHVIKGYSN